MRFSLTNTYTLTLGVALFLWPIVLGFTGTHERLLWIFGALGAFLFSTGMCSRVMKNSSPIELTRERFPWIPVLWLSAVLSVPLLWMPLTFFSDEAALAIPALTFLQKISRIVTWPGLTLIAIFGLIFFFLACQKLRRSQMLIIVLLLAGCAALVAVLVPTSTTLVVRYPPLVHVMQSISILLTGGHLDALRLPNLLWTLLLALSIWFLTPEWTPLQRALAFLIPILTPFGWTYRMLLYQACGEMTLGMTAALLLSRILTEEREGQRDTLVAALGVLLSLWILYRQTSIAILLTTLIFLFFKRKRSAFIVAGIAGPIAALSLGTYFLGSYQYEYLTKASSLPTVSAILQNLMNAAKVFPAQFHPAALVVLLLGSMIILQRSTPLMRSALLTSWFIALTNVAFHQAILPPILAGFARFSALLILPLAVTMAGLASLEVFPGRIPRKTLLGLCTLLLISITPFSFITFSQSIRTLPPSGIHRSVTGGDLPTPMPRAVRRMLEQTKDPVILQPDSAYLDLFIAKGMLTPEERTTLLKRSREWTPESSLRPVIIQAPGDRMTFAPNVPPEEEQKLRDAELWARTQPNVQEVRLGKVVTLIVR